MATTHPPTLDDFIVTLEPTGSGSSVTHGVTVGGLHTGLFVQERSWTPGPGFVDLVDESGNVVADDVADTRNAVAEAVINLIDDGMTARAKALV